MKFYHDNIKGKILEKNKESNNYYNHFLYYLPHKIF